MTGPKDRSDMSQSRLGSCCATCLLVAKQLLCSAVFATAKLLSIPRKGWDVLQQAIAVMHLHEGSLLPDKCPGQAFLVLRQWVIVDSDKH